MRRPRPDINDDAPKPLPMIEPPRPMKVRRHPQTGAPIFQNRGGLGDYAQFNEPHQKYWQVQDVNRPMPGMMPVIEPPVEISTQTMIHNQDLARAICECLSCTTIQVKRPNWVEPPSNALMLDQSTTSDGITLTAGAPGAFVEVLRVVVPDRWYAVISHFGNMLEDAAAFANVEWQIRVNDRAMPFTQYTGGGVVVGGIFTAQLGDPANPTKLSMPVIAKYGDSIRLMARSTDGNQHTAYARFMGWLYSVANVDAGGDPCTPNGMIPLWTDGNYAPPNPIT